MLGGTAIALGTLTFYDDFAKDKKRKQQKRKFRGGKQEKRDRNLQQFPNDFKKWFHKYYKSKYEPDKTTQELNELYDIWKSMGNPTVK